MSVKLHGYCKVNDTWKFNVISSIHNHVLQIELAVHPIVFHLKPEEKENILYMYLIRVAPKNILACLKQKRPESVSNIKQVYNVCYRNNMGRRGPRTEMQQLLNESHYVSRYKFCEDKVIVHDIFRTHPKSINLFNTFLIALIIYSTYKTNKYRLPLLEIIGVTSTENTFLVPFAFFEFEKEDNVTRALEICKTSLKDQETHVEYNCH